MIVSRTLRTWGDSESGLNEKLDTDHPPSSTRPATPRSPSSPADGRVSRSGSPPRHHLLDAASALLDHWGVRVTDIVGHNVFGLDDDTMESVVLQMLPGVVNRSVWPSRSPAVSLRPA